MSEVLKLTLTSKALENLLGGDTQAEIELRQSVAVHFARKYLKNALKECIGDEVSKFKVEVTNDLKELCREVLAEKGITGSSYSGYKVSLPAEAKQAIANTVRDEFYSTLKDKVKEWVEYYTKDYELKRYVESSVKDLVTSKVKAVFNEALSNLK